MTDFADMMTNPLCKKSPLVQGADVRVILLAGRPQRASCMRRQGRASSSA